MLWVVFVVVFVFLNLNLKMCLIYPKVSHETFHFIPYKYPFDIGVIIILSIIPIVKLRFREINGL